MINLRYHIVSLTAVFLALGIGVMLGGTYLDKYTVDQLDKNIATAERRISEVRADNRGLQSDVDAAEARELALLADGSSRLLGGELTDVPVLIVLGPGVNNTADDGVRLVLTQAGADVRGSLVLRDRLLFDSDEVDRPLAEALGIKATTPAQLRAGINAQLVTAMSAAGQEIVVVPDTTTTTTVPGGPTVPGEATTTAPGTTASTLPSPSTASTEPGETTSTSTTVPVDVDPGSVDPDGQQPRVITELLARGYATVEAAPGREGDPILETRGYRYVFVTTEGPSSAQNAAFAALLSPRADRVSPSVVVSPQPPVDADAAGRTLVGRVRADATMRGLYATVDNVDDFSGLVALVFVLDGLPDAPPGHYGQGPGAQAVLPGST